MINLPIKSLTETFALTCGPDALTRFCRQNFPLIFTVLLLFIVAGCTSESEEASKNESVGIELANTAILDQTENGSESTAIPGNGISGGFTISAPAAAQSVILPGLVVTDYIIVSSKRTGRTRMEYILKLKISNGGSVSYQNVMATLLSAPQHIIIVDNIAIVGDVPPNSTILSQDSFTIDINLAQNTLFEDLVWQIDGAIKPPPPPPPGSDPTGVGVFMNIDNNSIPGESTTASHKNWIELTSFREGLHRDNAGSTGTSRRRSSFVFDGVQVMKLVDRSSPKLRQALADGRIFTEIRIDVINSCGGNPFTEYAITLSIARLEALNLQAVINDIPTEEVSFDYTRIETMYTPVTNDCRLLPPVFSTQDGELLGL